MKFSSSLVAIVSTLSMAAVIPVGAQQTPPVPSTSMPMKPGATPAEGSMISAMDRMSKDMAAVPMTGDVDRDFVGMMLPHHQGAVDMAKFELAHGKNPAMLKLARAIVAAQDKEIAEMKAWQAKQPTAK
jgi:uncharacterized protein (DUF305 family)